MLVQCPYSNSIWMDLAPWIGTPIQQPPTSGYHRFRVWWWHMSQAGVQGMTQSQVCAQKMVYTAWNIWKEHSR
jgi:hypothetical protein